MTALIFANGDIADVAWIRPYLDQATAILAADGGTRHLLALGARPDAILGDMDSLPVEAQAWLETAVVQKVQVPPAKDETDLELALLYAESHYSGEILVFGAFGGRIDQTLGNIFLLAHPALVGRSVALLDEHQRVWLITAQDGPVTINGRSGDTVSFIPCGAEVKVQQTTGLAWPLHQEVLAFGPARGLSNRMTADAATVEMGNGRLICVHTRQSWQR